MMRNAMALLPDGAFLCGDPRVGIPAADCTGLLADAASQYPGQLLRSYIEEQSGSVTFGEDGSYDTPDPAVSITWSLYVDGVFVETTQEVLGTPIFYPGRRRHRSGSGGIGAVSGGGGHGVVS